jgi:hypothetical protein
MSFVKLKHKLTIDDYQIGEQIVSYGVSKIRYCRVSTSAKLFEVIPERYRDQFMLRSMEIIYKVPPHTDNGITCALNFYITPGNYVTKFWSIKDNNNDRTYQIKNQTNGKVFFYDAVEFVDSFEAEKGDIYLLDVTKPHSVETEKPNKRFALCIQTNRYSFNEVKEMLFETEYL